MASVWILRDGKPERVSVKTGLSDGRDTEIITDELTEGDEVIIRQIIAAPAP